MTKRDYSEPNRFTLKMLYNDKLIVTVDRNGNEREAKRDIFKFPFKEPKTLGNNHLNDGDLIQDDGNKPHQFEKNVFENSWAAVEMGECMTDIFRLAMRVGTEDFIDREYQDKKRRGLSLEYFPENKSTDNVFSLVLTDNLSLKRDSSGTIVGVKALTNKISVLKEKEDFEGLSNEEFKTLTSLKRQLKNSYVAREIFKCNFSADDFSYDGENFTPPLSKLWKDFNVYFRNAPYNGSREEVQFADISDYNNIMNTLSNFKRERRKVLDALDEASLLHDNIRTRALEKALAVVSKKIAYRENIYFKGLRSIIKEYLNLDYYENRFTTPKTKYNNFRTNTSENEITGMASML